ncbi:MAG: urea ABC transporter permease subunit UrtB, partial [Microvirga sp.]
MMTLRDGLKVCFLLVALAWAPVAVAGPFEDSVPKFSADSYSDTEAAITAVAASGHPQALPVIEALRDGRLLAGGGRVLVRDAAGALSDAVTGQAVAGPAPADLKPVRLNNRVRRAVEAALGSMTLLSSDPGRRLDAARAVFRSKDAAALPVLDQAIAKETDPTVRTVLAQARAAIVLAAADAAPADRLAAIGVLKERGDQDALALLSSVTGAPDVVEAAGSAAAGIRSRLALWNALQNVWYGVSLGSVLLLAAIGLAITFGTMGVINMAHGEMVMIGAYTTFMVQELIRTNAPGLFGASLFIALPLAFLVAGGIGILIERTVIRFLYGRPLETLLATWGLSLMLQQAVRS